MSKRDFLTRRDVMTGTSAVGLSAVAATQASDLTQDSDPETSDPRELRFVETEHVRTYYALARS